MADDPASGTTFPVALIDQLRDPRTGEPLQLESLLGDDRRVRAGLLFSSTAVYPVHNGIPRFVWSTATRDEFLADWRNALNERISTDRRLADFARQVPQTTRTQAMYDFQWRTLDLTNTDLSRRQVERNLGPGEPSARAKLGLEIGCGNGRHSEHLLGYAETIVSVDFGDHIEVAAARCAGNPALAFVQASALELPFPSHAFGLVFTSGVLMHTPSTHEAFTNAARVLAPGGRLSCWVYARWRWQTLQRLVDAVRRVCSRLPWRLVLAVSYVLAPLLPLVAKPLGYRFQQANPTYRDCVYYLFDWFTPEFQWKHTNEELVRWCEELGLRVLETLDPPAGVLAYRD